MTSKEVTEYERKRLENMKRNEELLASLNIKSKLSDLFASVKRGRAGTESYKFSLEKKVRSETPIVIRRSLRTQGKAPDSAGLKLTNKKLPVLPNKDPRELIPISMRDASTSSKSDEALVSKILSVSKESGMKDCDCGKKFRVMASIDLNLMELAPEHVARVVPNRILSVKFFPSADMSIVAVGDNFGDVGFWNVDSEDKDGDGIYTYRPHPAPVSAIVIQPFSLNKIITSSYDGQIRSLDIEKEMFDLAYSTERAIFSMSQRLDDVNSLYFSEAHGVVRSWDERSGKTSFSWELHETRINSIDFNSENVNLMATSSRDRTVCIWDLRKLGKRKPNSLKIITRERAVQSAYFSPSGSHLATTSLDAKIRVLSGANYDDEFMINHNNQPCTQRSKFRGVWGWDDTHIFMGNTKRGVDIISAEERRFVTTLDSPHVTATPLCVDAHPLKPGMLAGVTSGGKVYIWST